MNWSYAVIIQPFLYLAILLIFMQYYRQERLERQLFGVRFHHALLETGVSLIYGAAGGLVASLITVGLGLVLSPEDMLWVWAVTILLFLFRVRFLCFAYAAGVLGVLQGIVRLWPHPALPEGLAGLWRSFLSIQVPSILALVAVLHLIEALMIWTRKETSASPLVMKSKRGKLIGGYQLQGFWLIPLLTAVSWQQGGGGFTLPFAWWPLWPGNASEESIRLLFIPAVVGFADIATSMLPRQKLRRSALSMMVFSLVLLGLAFISRFSVMLMMAAAIFSIAAHEGLVLYGQWLEKKRMPYFVPAGEGLKVLAVIPGSPAKEMGILPGEVIRKVNGIAVRNRSQLYQAIQTQPVYCRLEVINRAGEVKLAQRSLYAGEHHQLGLVIVPDEKTSFYVETKAFSPLQLLKNRFVFKKTNKKAEM
jgi:hypothetical protein